MTATCGPLPKDPLEYSWENDWPGLRVLAWTEGGGLRLWNSVLGDVTERFPHLANLAVPLQQKGLVLDATLTLGTITPHEAEFSNRTPLETSRHLKLAGAAARLALTDLLMHEGHSTINLPYRQRREMLDGLELASDAWWTPPAFVGDWSALLAAAARMGHRTVLAKRLESQYKPGRRARAWRRVAAPRHDYFVIGGWQPSWSPGNALRIAALALGRFDEPTRSFRHEATVEVPVDDAHLLRQLLGLQRSESPFGPNPNPDCQADEVVHVEPVLVCEVQRESSCESGWNYLRLCPKLDARLI